MDISQNILHHSKGVFPKESNLSQNLKSGLLRLISDYMDCCRDNTSLGITNNSGKAAFTLAEVLITIGIIGVVAALTLPGVITNYEKKRTEVQLAKTYSVLANALKMAENEYGPADNWDKDGGLTLFFQRLEPYLKLAKPPCYSNCLKVPASSSSSTHIYGVYFRVVDGTCGILTCTDCGYGDNFGGDVTSAINYYFNIYTAKSCTERNIDGINTFKIGFINLKYARVLQNSDCSYFTIINGKKYCVLGENSSFYPECDAGEVWADYNCYMKYMIDGFIFTKDYPWDKLKKSRWGRLNDFFDQFKNGYSVDGW